MKLRFTILTEGPSKGFGENSKKVRHLRDLVSSARAAQNKSHQRVYLDDADDFYFWIYYKIFITKKVTSNQRCIPPLDIRCIPRSYQEMQRDHEGGLYTQAIVPL